MRNLILATLIALSLPVLTSCGASAAASETTAAERDSDHAEDTATTGADDAEDAARVDSDEERGGETYAEFDQRRDAIAPSPGQVGDYGCTQDCSGHDAGYQWASSRGIDDPDNCGGQSWSFDEGCRAYAEEQRSSRETDDEE